MNEEDLDKFLLQPLDHLELTKIDARMRRSATLAQALWGKTLQDLERQLVAPHPALPPTFDLADYRELERSTQRVLVLLKSERVARLLAAMNSTFVAAMKSTVIIGTTKYTEMEARHEIVRRAIEYLEGR
jgi:hypothetical protein